MSAQALGSIDRRWLIPIAGVSVLVSIWRSPAFWLSGAGVVLLALVITANSQRTGQWSYIPWAANQNSQLTPGEKFAAQTALILIATPLVVIVFIAATFWGVH